MAGSGPGDLDALCHDLKAVALAALDSIPTYPATATLSGAPDRAFVSFGTPVWDCCDMLAVWVPTITDKYALPSGGTVKMNTPNLNVGVTRCVPEGAVVGKSYRPPTVAQIEAAARQTNADGWALWNHVWNAIRAGVFLDTCTEVTFLSQTEYQPQGGCAGWLLSFNVILDGYEEVFGT